MAAASPVPVVASRQSSSGTVITPSHYKAQIISSSPWFDQGLSVSQVGTSTSLTPSAYASRSPSVPLFASSIPLLSPSSVKSAAQEAFFRADSTRTGWLTLFEFRAAMRQLGFALSDQSTVHFFREIDNEG
jgi:hypothetical protein